jgi:hypothetical protein
MVSFIASDKLAFALLRLGALGLVFGFKFAACFSFDYDGLQWLMRRDDGYD